MTEAAVLAAVARGKQSGREVAQTYAADNESEITYGTLYTTLRRLKEKGFVDTEDGQDEDGRIRYFEITAKGQGALAQAHRALTALANVTALPWRAAT